MTHIFVGDVDVPLTFEAKVDLTEAIAVSLIVRTPKSGPKEWTPDSYEGTQIFYRTQATDLTEPGDFFIQSKATFNVGEPKYGDITKIHVYPRVA